MKLVNFLAAAIAVLASQSASSARVTVLHTNDTHSHVDDGVVPFSEIAAERARLESAWIRPDETDVTWTRRMA